MEINLFLKIATEVVGGLGIFLIGMKYMSEGLQAVAGSRLRKTISLMTNNRVMGVLAGMFVTCLVQSSSITTVMVVGLVNSGFMTLIQAIGVIFGANIGTTITGWILVLDIGKHGLPILGIAAFFFLFSKSDRLRYAGMAFMGIGMVFFGLELMKNGFKPLRAHEGFCIWFHAFEADSYLNVLKCAAVGCILTMLVQSSSATLGITMGLAATGVIQFPTAAALVLGENIGTTITAFLASVGTNTNAKRAAYAHILFNLLGAIWITAVFRWYLPLIESLVGHDPGMMVMHNGEETYPHIMRGIALVHTGFNVVNTLLFLPFTGLLARLVVRLVPDRKTAEVKHLKYLDVRMLDTPSLSIVQSQEQIHFMAESVEDMLARLKNCLEKTEPQYEDEHKIFHREEILDSVQKEIFLFLSRLITGQVPQQVTDEAHRQMRMADEYESLSDYVASILKCIKKLQQDQMALNPVGKGNLLELHDRVAAYVKKVNQCILQEDRDVLTWANAEGAAISELMKRFRREHLTRLQREEVSPLVSLIHTDMLSFYRRMKDHALNIAEVAAGAK